MIRVTHHFIKRKPFNNNDLVAIVGRRFESKFVSPKNEHLQWLIFMLKIDRNSGVKFNGCIKIRHLFLGSYTLLLWILLQDVSALAAEGEL